MRQAKIERNTNETQISLMLNVDGRGESKIVTGVPFLNHMLELFARHGRFDLVVSAKGDTEIDYHHSVEDIGICLGKAFFEAMGDMRGIVRYGQSLLPMDETLVMCAMDFSGRAYLNYDVEITSEKVGDFDVELVEEFLLGFVRHAQVSVHIKQMAGTNTHHIIEACYKALARAMRQAVAIDKEYSKEIPSTKGRLI